MKISSYFLAFIVIAIVSGCSSGLELTTENPYSQASVVIHLKNGYKKEGIVLKREQDKLVYIDSKSHKREMIDYSQIQKLSEASVHYDFEANAIPNYVIDEEKGTKNTLAYGSGGFLLGAALGAGFGVGLVGAGADISPLISIAVFGIGGAWYLGAKGSDRDFEDAVFDVRKKRYLISKGKQQKEIEEARRKLAEQKKKKEELEQKVKEKKKKK